MSENIWQNYGQIVTSKYKREVVLNLLSHPKTPTQISKEMGIGIAHVSRALRELVKIQAVICLTPSRRKGRVYKLTEKGVDIAKVIEKNRLKKQNS